MRKQEKAKANLLKPWGSKRSGQDSCYPGITLMNLAERRYMQTGTLD
jgi:hypothetical protein